MALDLADVQAGIKSFGIPSTIRRTTMASSFPSSAKTNGRIWLERRG